MARTFDGVDDIINCGTGWTGPTTSTGATVAAWIYPTGWGEGNFGRIIDAWPIILLVDNDGTAPDATLRNSVGFATTDSARSAEANFISLNTWQFVAMVWDGGTLATSTKFFKGLPNNDVVESGSYGQATDGSGSLDSKGTFYVGNRAGADRTFAGRIANVFYADRQLSLTELNHLKFGLWQNARPKLYLPLFGETSAEPDFSGYANTGTVTGAVRSDHPPGISADWFAPITRRVQAVSAGGIVIPTLNQNMRGGFNNMRGGFING